MSGDGGVTTRYSFISVPGYDAWVQPAGGLPASPQSDCRGKVGEMYRSQTCASNL